MPRMTKKRFLQEVGDLSADLARQIERDRMAIIGEATVALLAAARPISLDNLRRELEGKKGGGLALDLMTRVLNGEKGGRVVEERYGESRKE